MFSGIINCFLFLHHFLFFNCIIGYILLDALGAMITFNFNDHETIVIRRGQTHHSNRIFYCTCMYICMYVKCMHVYLFKCRVEILFLL